MKQRLEQFLEAENLSKAQFADSIKVARAGISHIMAGRNNPSYEFIINTMAVYPDLNIEWLLTGKGPMYKNRSEDDLFSSLTPDQSSHYESAPASVMPQPVVEETPSPVEPEPAAPVSRPVPSVSKGKRIVILYDDGSYEEFS